MKWKIIIFFLVREGVGGVKIIIRWTYKMLFFMTKLKQLSNIHVKVIKLEFLMNIRGLHILVACDFTIICEYTKHNVSIFFAVYTQQAKLKF